MQGGAGQRRRLTGGVDVRTGELHQGFDQIVTAGNKRTRRAEGFAQGADQHRHVIQAQAKMLDNAGPRGTQRAEAVGIVDHHPGIGAARFGAQ